MDNKKQSEQIQEILEDLRPEIQTQLEQYAKRYLATAGRNEPKPTLRGLSYTTQFFSPGNTLTVEVKLDFGFAVVTRKHSSKIRLPGFPNLSAVNIAQRVLQQIQTMGPEMLKEMLARDPDDAFQAGLAALPFRGLDAAALSQAVRTVNRELSPTLTSQALQAANDHLYALRKGLSECPAWLRPGQAVSCKAVLTLSDSHMLTATCTMVTEYGQTCRDRVQNSRPWLLQILRAADVNQLKDLLRKEFQSMAEEAFRKIRNAFPAYEIIAPDEDAPQEFPPSLRDLLFQGHADLGLVSLETDFRKSAVDAQGKMLLPKDPKRLFLALSSRNQVFLTRTPFTEERATIAISIGRTGAGFPTEEDVLNRRIRTDTVLGMYRFFRYFSARYEQMELQDVQKPGILFRLKGCTPVSVSFGEVTQELSDQDRADLAADPRAWTEKRLTEIAAGCGSCRMRIRCSALS